MQSKRTVFFLSDRTGITAENLGHTLLTQFDTTEFKQMTLPFINTPDKARAAVDYVNQVAQESGKRPIIFSTTVNDEIRGIVRGAHEPRFEDARRQMDAALEHRMEEGGETVGRLPPDLREVSHARQLVRIDEEDTEEISGVLHKMGNAFLRERGADDLADGGGGVVQPGVDVGGREPKRGETGRRGHRVSGQRARLVDRTGRRQLRHVVQDGIELVRELRFLFLGQAKSGQHRHMLDFLDGDPHASFLTHGLADANLTNDCCFARRADLFAVPEPFG